MWLFCVYVIYLFFFILKKHWGDSSYSERACEGLCQWDWHLLMWLLFVYVIHLIFWFKKNWRDSLYSERACEGLCQWDWHLLMWLFRVYVIQLIILIWKRLERQLRLGESLWRFWKLGFTFINVTVLCVFHTFEFFGFKHIWRNSPYSERALIPTHPFMYPSISQICTYPTNQLEFVLEL